jgi:hypothetical protein
MGQPRAPLAGRIAYAEKHILVVAAAVCLASAAAAGAAKPAVTVPPAATAALDYRTGSLERFRDDLLDLAKHPSISALPAHTPDVLAAADWCACCAGPRRCSSSAFHLCPCTRSLPSTPTPTPPRLKSKLSSIGLSRVEVLPTEGPQPVVYAEHRAAAATADTPTGTGVASFWPVSFPAAVCLLCCFASSPASYSTCTTNTPTSTPPH